MGISSCCFRATVVLAPEAKLRSHSDLFQQREADQYGRFSIDAIPPGGYKLFAWEDVEPGTWWNPEFLKKYEEKGESVTIAAKGKVTTKVNVQ